MINIFFVPGMFGSTMEFMLRNFTNEFEPVRGKILDDGSMHSFHKEFHAHPAGIEELFKNFNDSIEITTVFYPEKNHKLEWILQNWPGDLNKSKNVIITANSFKDAELNLLFSYYKIATGSLNLGLDLIFNNNNLEQWNKKHKSWSDAATWELRESFSIFYSDFLAEWMIKNPNISDLFVLSNTDILFDLERTFFKLINFLNLTPRLKNFKEFIHEWQNKQQYIVDEFNLLEKIVENTLNNKNFDWSNYRLCLISEAIIQQRLRQQGYEIKCWNLDIFPTNTKDLINLLEKT